MDMITSLTSRVLNKAMDGLSKRHTAIASNLANVDTPNYKRQDVIFESALGKAMESEKSRQRGIQNAKPQVASNDEELQMTASRPDHFGISGSISLDNFTPTVEEADEHMSFRNDGNTVDLESEMAQLAKNTQRYTALANIEGRRGKSLRSVLNS